MTSLDVMFRGAITINHLEKTMNVALRIGLTKWQVEQIEKAAELEKKWFDIDAETDWEAFKKKKEECERQERRVARMMIDIIDELPF